MPLIKCSECGKMICDRAACCPNCGSPTQTTNRNPHLSAKKELPSYQSESEKRIHKNLIIALLGIILVLILGVFFLLNFNSSRKKAQKNPISRDSIHSVQKVDSSVVKSQEKVAEVAEDAVDSILPIKTFNVNGVQFSMVYVKGGTFKMGKTKEQGTNSLENNLPVHNVTLSDYYIGQTEVTQKLWKAVMGKYNSEFKGEKRPVENANWNDCQTFIRKLNSMTGQLFRLPTEAEWEYAARGGINSRRYKYSGSNNIGKVAWYEDSNTHDVATKSPNELGIYDMSGNVWELCQDYWSPHYSSKSQVNPKGPKEPSSSGLRVIRGGCSGAQPDVCCSAYRESTYPDSGHGFRLAL